MVTIWIEQYPRDFDEPTEYASLNQLIHFTKQRKLLQPVERLYLLCEGKLNTLTVSPYDDESELVSLSCCSIIEILILYSTYFVRFKVNSIYKKYNYGKYNCF